MIVEYVLGFMFDTRKMSVVLVEKQKPEWQKGLWNGVGGKIEHGESPATAMSREFEEETTLATAPEDWHKFAIIDGNGYVVHCFRTFSDDLFVCKPVQQPDGIVEDIQVHSTHWPPRKSAIKNIPWLINLAMDDEPTFASIRYP